MQNWITELQDFDFEIFYKTGKSNVVADSLSRNPCIEIIKEAISYTITNTYTSNSPEGSRVVSQATVEDSRHSLQNVLKPIRPEESKAIGTKDASIRPEDSKAIETGKRVEDSRPHVESVQPTHTNETQPTLHAHDTMLPVTDSGDNHNEIAAKKRPVGRPKKGSEKPKETVPNVNKYNLRSRNRHENMDAESGKTRNYDENEEILNKNDKMNSKSKETPTEEIKELQNREEE